MIRKYVRQIGRYATGNNAAKRLAAIESYREVDRLKQIVLEKMPNDPVLTGFKVYSQNDEDGIIEHIFRLIGAGSTFLEIGVENGTECNTHFLMLKGWRGCWIDGSPTMCQQIEANLGARKFDNKFELVESFVTAENIVDLYKRTIQFTDVDDLDLFSLDIDGNDLYVIEALLASGARPSVICAEYNGKFPPPFVTTVNYRATRCWEADEFFGASLQAIHDVAAVAGYKPVTCNITGANIFMVRSELAHLFPSFSISEIWRPLRLELCPLPTSHKPTLKFLKQTLLS